MELIESNTDNINFLLNLLKKYNYSIPKYDELEDLCIEISKIKDINHNIINYVFKNIFTFTFSTSVKNIYFENLLFNLKESDENNLNNNLKNIKHLYFKEYTNKIKEILNILSDKFINKKNSVSLLKSYTIYLNRSNNSKNININKKIIITISLLINTKKKTRLIFYIKKLKKYIKLNIDIIDKKIIIDHLNNLINIKYLTNNIKNEVSENNDKYILIFLKLINFIKKNYKSIESNNNDFEQILTKVSKNIYDYVYFLKNSKNLLIEKTASINFINLLGFSKKEYKEIENLNLKRGFIQGLFKNNKKYLLKFQPNKSFMELVINFYIKSLSLKPEHNNFLLPEYFFINQDNSYFYIIEKFDSDLYKYFNKLDENSKNFKIDDVLKIIFFIMNSIKILHDNNIIHSDLKPENIILNYDNDYKINNLKIIDFDVSLFNEIPEFLKKLPNPFEKIIQNKKPRGTRIYMLKNETMSFKNDIYSLGIIIIMLLYKTIKLQISNNKKKLKEDEIKNKKEIIKQNSFIKKLNVLKDNIEKKESKNKLIENIINYFKRNERIIDNLNKITYLKDCINDCINPDKNINELLSIYSEKLFDKPFSNNFE